MSLVHLDTTLAACCGCPAGGGRGRGREGGGGDREIRFSNCYVTRPVVGRLLGWEILVGDKLGSGWFVNVEEDGEEGFFFFLFSFFFKRNINLNIREEYTSV